MELTVRPITEENEAVLNLPNDPFLNTGRVVPIFDGAVWSRVIEAYPENMVTEDCFPDEHYVYEELWEGFAGFAAYADGIPAGFALCRHDWSRYLYLDNLLVRSAYRRMGVGTALLHACLEKAEELGLIGVSTVCQDNNPGAFLLYERCGFALGGCDTRVYDGTSQAGKTDLLLYRRI